ncbi:hypothetical protein WN944_024130 [Citrus x changshan-huyou]|uniref:N-acetyltransferase domain-containing protein n=1 Tax=Citrus x changshan-huyou TaxID=2935761 RepID=A0AAP0QAD4_9ROSI
MAILYLRYLYRGGVYFVLVNPKDAEDRCSKSYLQDVLQIYSRELLAMNYAGKRSIFPEKCVVAAVIYQIVPADTRYAEVPLAAVSSIYQHKGVGRLLYLKLRKRLQSVGIRTIFCWDDKESSTEPERVVIDGCSREGAKLGGFPPSLDTVHDSGDLATFEKVHCSNMTVGAAQIGADTGAKHCSFSQGQRRGGSL